MTGINSNTSTENEFCFFYFPAVVICTLGVVSNVLLLVAFIKDPLKCFRNSGTYLVMNLSVSDCLTSLIGLLSNITVTGRISSHLILQFFNHSTAGASFISITSISVDRFLMVTSPIKHRILMQGKVIVLWISAIWIMNFVLPFPLIVSDIDESNARRGLCNFNTIVIILSSVIYSSTYYKLKEQSRNIALQNSTESRAQEIRILKEKRFLKTIIFIACIAFIGTVPFFVFFSVHISVSFLVDDSKAFALFIAISTSIFDINFAVNH